MTDFAFQDGKALLNQDALYRGLGNSVERSIPIFGHRLGERREQSGDGIVIPFMFNHLHSGAQRETDLVA